MTPRVCIMGEMDRLASFHPSAFSLQPSFLGATPILRVCIKHEQHGPEPFYPVSCILSKEVIAMVKEFTVPAVSCGHCVNAITKEVSALQGVTKVDVNLNTKHVKVETDGQVSTEAIVEAINEAGYDEVSILN